MIGWTHVDVDGVTWEVRNVYLAPMSIGGAAAHAEEMGCELPTPAMVDAIWLAASLKVDPLPRKHNGTLAEMATAPVYESQADRIAAQLGYVDFATTLVAGTHKDVVRSAATKKIGIYGWHHATGKPIQKPYYQHSADWIDYSQGLRLCRRV